VARLKIVRLTLGFALIAVGLVLAAIPDDWIETATGWSAPITAMDLRKPLWRGFHSPPDAFSRPTLSFPRFCGPSRRPWPADSQSGANPVGLRRDDGRDRARLSLRLATLAADGASERPPGAAVAPNPPTGQKKDGLS
jgi:hypothetical protein